MNAEAKREPAGAARLAIDIGPLLVFFLVNFLAPVPGALKIFVATGAFMVAMIAAMLFSAIRYRSISPLLWFSGVMVVLLSPMCARAQELPPEYTGPPVPVAPDVIGTASATVRGNRSAGSDAK